MKAHEALNPNAVFLHQGQTIGEASRLLLKNSLNRAAVLGNNHECMGTISKDLLLEALLNGLSQETDIQEIMQAQCYNLAFDDEVSLEYSNQMDFGVVFKDGIPAGVIEPSDVLRAYAVREEEEKAGLRATLDAVYTPVIAIDNNKTIKIINKWAEKAFCINETTALYANAEEIISNPEILELLTGEIVYPNNKVTFSGSSYIPYCKDVFINQERIGRVLVLRDISEIEMLVRESEYTKRLNDELEAIIESSFDGLYVTDGHANTLRINKGFERIMGITHEQCVGRNMVDLVKEGVFSRSGTLAALKTGKRASLTLTASTGKEALVTSNPIYDENGNIILVVTNVRDITELNELERKLEHVEGLREREMEAVIESMFDGLYVTDGQANTLRLNKGFERIMGITHQQCVGRNMADLVKDGVFSRSGTLAAIEKGERATLTLTASTGKEALVTSNPIYDDKGNIIMVVTNVRDITELNKLQRRLERVEGLHELYKTELQQMKLVNSRNLVMTSAKMKELVNMVIRVAAVDSTLLIQGESGVGKDLIADIIHSNSNCKEGPFIRVNCGAIPENLLESELFGYEAGAFTGASKTGKVGLFELARGGILFLDEIGELPLNLQVKLLRALQDKEIMRVGGVEPIKVECRIIAGTNRNLMEMIDKGQFRLDLYYRLNVIPIMVPPLRERQEDIPVLMNYFINVFNEKYGMKKRLDNSVYNCLVEYSWPGNVRELENLMERLVVTSINNIITIKDLPANIENGSAQTEEDKRLIPLRQAVENTERELLENAFTRYRSSYQVARVLEVNQSTVVRKAQKYGIKH
jgi:PAS domain S-box-containing protein